MNNIITSEARFRQRVIKYSHKYGVTKACNRFHRCRQAIYEWRHKYDGKSWKSLVDKSHRPHHHPKEHTQADYNQTIICVLYLYKMVRFLIKIEPF